MNNSYITIIKEKRTALSRKRVPLNQNECTDDFRIGVPFEQNLHSMCNDDENDNRFYEPIGRFPEIEEDEPAYRLLCNEYPKAK